MYTNTNIVTLLVSYWLAGVYVLLLLLHITIAPHYYHADYAGRWAIMIHDMMLHSYYGTILVC